MTGDEAHRQSETKLGSTEELAKKHEKRRGAKTNLCCDLMQTVLKNC